MEVQTQPRTDIIHDLYESLVEIQTELLNEPATDSTIHEFCAKYCSKLNEFRAERLIESYEVNHKTDHSLQMYVFGRGREFKVGFLHLNRLESDPTRLYVDFNIHK